MNIFTLLFGLAMFFFATLAVVCIVLVLWLGRKWTWPAKLGGCIGACLPLYGTMLLWSWFTVYDPSDPEELSRGFEYELHQPRTWDVVDVKIRRVVIGDGVGSWVRFEADPVTIDSILVHFVPSDKATFSKRSKGDLPDWWMPDEDHMTHFYAVEHWEEGCSTFSDAFFAHDEAKRTAYFHHSGS